MTEKATGYFETEVDREPPYDAEPGAELARSTMTKTFHGDLAGTSDAQILRATSAVAGSGGYVAIERFTGALDGRQGSFVMQYNAIVNRGDGFVNVEVIPDTATGELTDLAGTLWLDIVDGKQQYTLEYTLPR